MSQTEHVASHISLKNLKDNRQSLKNGKSVMQKTE